MGSVHIIPVRQRGTGPEIAVCLTYNWRAARPRNRPPPWTEESASNCSPWRTSVKPREGMCMHIKTWVKSKKLDAIPLSSRAKARDTLWFRCHPSGEDEIQKCDCMSFHSCLSAYFWPSYFLAGIWGEVRMLWEGGHLCGFPTCCFLIPY